MNALVKHAASVITAAFLLFLVTRAATAFAAQTSSACYAAKSRKRFEDLMKPIASIQNGPIVLRISGVLMCLCLAALPAHADGAYQCEAGPNAAVVTACAARWEAANIRAHVAAGSFGGASPSCLTKTAALLDQIAAKTLAADKPLTITGAWPCGKEPAIAKADDGTLAQACPRAVWSYENKGLSGCKPATSVHAAQSGSPPQPAGPGLDETFQWLSTNVPILGRYDYNVSERGNVDHHHFRPSFSNDGCLMHWTVESSTETVMENGAVKITGPDRNVQDIPLQFVDIKESLVPVPGEVAGSSTAYIRIPMTRENAISFTIDFAASDYGNGLHDDPYRQAGSTSVGSLGPFPDLKSASRIAAALNRAVSLCAASEKSSPF